MARERFDHEGVEKEAQKKWEADKSYQTNPASGKPKKYVLDMFPYPSGKGLHVGHPKGYIATDIYSRFSRMKGFEVLHPMGWDAFGLPAENYALKNKVHPRVAVEKNVAHFKAQLEHIGFDYDWSREISTTDPAFYKWTQWIFLKMYEKGLAFQSNEPINWCPSCMTGLANEDLDGTVCERCGTEVEKKALPQWVLKITEYADRLLADLDTLNWPEHIKEAQRNWIGRSEGAYLDFPIAGSEENVRVFTTRPDTLFGATFLVLAPEHPLIAALGASLKNADEVTAYQAQAKAKTEIERTDATKEKTGVKLDGILAINPATKEEIPLYIADYVIGSYGTGAIMAVPAHDERDFAFAKKYELPVRQVIVPDNLDQKNPPREGKKDTERHVVHVILRNTVQKTVLVAFLKDESWGDQKPVNFIIGGIEEGESAETAALREIGEETGYTDVRFVEEIPLQIDARFYQAQKDVNRLVHVRTLVFDLVSDAQTEVAEEEKALHEFTWIPESEVARILTIPDDCLSWRYLSEGGFAYTQPGPLINSGEFNGMSFDEAKKKITEFAGGEVATTYKIKDWVFSRQRYWGEPIPIIHCEKDGAVAVPLKDLPVLLPEVDSYEPSGTGESPLANITEWVNTTCPTCGGPGKRETNTMPQWAGSSWYYLRFMDPANTEALVSKEAEQYFAPVDVYVGGDHAVRHLIYARFWHKFLYDIGAVSTLEPFKRLEFLGFILAEDGRKMSKRYGNVINPDDVVKEYGADAFRVYEMFMGPFEGTTAWNTASIAGTARFIERVWRAEDLVVEEPSRALEGVLHQTIQKVGDDVEAFKFNTAVSQMMIFMNALETEGTIGKEQWKAFLRVLAPFAPHITEKLWENAGGEGSVHQAVWPVADPNHLMISRAVIVQVNGKKRGEIELGADASEEEAVLAALALPGVAAALEGKEVLRRVYVPGKILNVVVK